MITIQYLWKFKSRKCWNHNSRWCVIKQYFPQYSCTHNCINIKKIKLDASEEWLEAGPVLKQFQLKLPAASNSLSNAHTHTHTDTHTHIQTHRCVSVSRMQFYNQFGLGGGVGWCSLLQSKSQSDCCSNSASRAINFTSPTTGELAVVKNMSSGRERRFPCVPAVWAALSSACPHADLHFGFTPFFCLSEDALLR